MPSGWEGVMRPRRQRQPVKASVTSPEFIPRAREVCDADHVAAAVKVVRTPKGDLYFCKHHYRRHIIEITIRGYGHEDL